MSAGVVAALLGGVVAGYAVAVPIGAVGVLLVDLGSRTRCAIGLAAALGVATVDAGYCLAVGLGAGVLGPALRAWSGPLRWTSAAALLVVAVRVAWPLLRRGRSELPAAPPLAPSTALRAYLSLLALTAVNPATVVCFLGLATGRPESRPDDAVAMTCGVALASASWQVLLVATGGLLAGALRTPRARQYSAAGAAVLLVLLALRALW